LAEVVYHVDGVVLHHPAFHAWHDEGVPQRGCLEEGTTHRKLGHEGTAGAILRRLKQVQCCSACVHATSSGHPHHLVNRYFDPRGSMPVLRCAHQFSLLQGGVSLPLGLFGQPHPLQNIVCFVLLVADQEG
jgi:hypothetical protein